MIQKHTEARCVNRHAKDFFHSEIKTLYNIHKASPSSRGLGHRPLTAATGVRIPLGTPFKTETCTVLVKATTIPLKIECGKQPSTRVCSQ